MAEDVNYHKINGIKNYYLDIPMPFGMPKFIASKTFPIAQKLGITSRKTVSSFDQVLQFTGNLDYKYLKKSVDSICKAITGFNPDIIYSEFNVSAFIAARLSKKKIYATVSYPTQHEYANNPKLSKGLNKLLGELEIEKVQSVLQLFNWADRCFCPSIKEIEPFKKDNVIFCGALKAPYVKNGVRNKIVVYMGNGTISAKKIEKVVKEAFCDSKYDGYIAAAYLHEKTEGNIHIASRWNFNELLSEAVLFINHGGQNSMMDGLMYRVPQIVVPGKVFERCYNAKSLVDNNAGAMILTKDFNATNLRKKAEIIINSDTVMDSVRSLSGKLEKQGGINNIIKYLQ